ncbi:MAG: tRNA (guanosine(37)-N1)-methyltransferase TrmD [Candidatus Sungbacteria bacterium]|nr:tRNA (guanosine(37)-N1)-methyltransferase TrmD [Candidatus Sungbacteria bacterium]
MRFDIITIFPKIIDAYLGESIMRRARAKKLAEFYIHDLRDYTKEQHRKVDDRPFGGGPGMVLKIEPIAGALHSILKISNFQFPISKRKKIKIVVFSAAGKQFTQKMAAEWAKKCDRIIMVCGRYEGIDDRIKKVVIENWKLKIENLSIGPYVLTGGELPALILADAVSRHIPGVLGKGESLEENRYGIGVPVYTRPEVFQWPASGRGKKKKKYRVPKALLSGDHKKIGEWRKKYAR